MSQPLEMTVPDRAELTRQRSRWTGERIARLGFLMGLGWDGERISTDPIVRSTPNNIYRQAVRFGLSFRTFNSMAWALLPPEATDHYDKAAQMRGLTRESLIRLLLIEIASDQHLLDNILDDGY
jgi:hypothetical protein